MRKEDETLLARVLLWRVARARPRDAGGHDVDRRLRRAGAEFRSGSRPFSGEELAEAVRRLTSTR